VAAEARTGRPLDGEEFVRIPHRVDAEEEHVEEREGDGDDAEAERDRRDDGQRHERRPAEGAERETNVAGQRLEEVDAPFVAALVRRERYRAEACARVLERLRGIDAGGHQLSRFTLDMKGKFVVELPLNGVGLEDGADAELETAQFHDQASFMTRSIAADIRSHSLASTAS